jgi:phosphoglycerate dehydrogenase-like enzyme
MIALLRDGAFRVNELILAGKFPRRDLNGHEAFEKRFGIIGLGRIGLAARRRTHRF